MSAKHTLLQRAIQLYIAIISYICACMTATVATMYAYGVKLCACIL